MGMFNAYRNLNQEGVAEKLYKFQMAAMRDAARSGGFTDQRHVEVLEGGPCTGYTLLWLREQWRGDGAFAFARDGTYTGNLGMGNANGGVGMLGIRLQTLFERNTNSLQDIAMAMKAIGRAVGLDLDVDNTRQFETFSQALEDLNNADEKGVYYAEMHMKINGRETSHAVGVNVSPDGNLYVFDANCGEYRVTSPTVFGMELCEVYEAKINAKFWKEVCMVTRVSPRLTIA
jgi:hypothetical protein